MSLLDVVADVLLLPAMCCTIAWFWAAFTTRLTQRDPHRPPSWVRAVRRALGPWYLPSVAVVAWNQAQVTGWLSVENLVGVALWVAVWWWLRDDDDERLRRLRRTAGERVARFCARLVVVPVRGPA